jgi:hypothetical protein
MIKGRLKQTAFLFTVSMNKGRPSQDSPIAPLKNTTTLLVFQAVLTLLLLQPVDPVIIYLFVSGIDPFEHKV